MEMKMARPASTFRTRTRIGPVLVTLSVYRLGPHLVRAGREGKYALSQRQADHSKGPWARQRLSARVGADSRASRGTSTNAAASGLKRWARTSAARPSTTLTTT